jgi:transketolase
MDNSRLKRLKRTAIDIRKDSLDMQVEAKSGHLGGAFSAVEIMTYLYFELMDIDTDNPYKEDRDIFIMSKGHASLSYYSVLARRGFFPMEELATYRKINTRLQGHTHIDSVPGVECSTGSLGQGLSFGIGIGLGYKKKGIKNKVYVLLGDGEIQEGQIWEALMLNGSLRLDNVIPIIDNNKIQLGDYSSNVVGKWQLKEKLEAFNHNVIEIDGHDFNQIEEAFNSIKPNQANVIIANTVKGKGVSFMEDKIEWHSKKMNDAEYHKALEEMEREEALIDG